MATIGNNTNGNIANLRDDLLSSMNPKFVAASQIHMTHPNCIIKGLATLGYPTLAKIKKTFEMKINYKEDAKLYKFFMAILACEEFTPAHINFLKKQQPDTFFTLIEIIDYCVDIGVFNEDEMETVQSFITLLLNCIEDAQSVRILERD